jgi:hypothetical protein
MQLGATMWFTEYSMSPSELAIALEERGFDSLWASEHSHLPVPSDFGDGELSKVQADVMDPFLTLTTAAMSTKTLRLGHKRFEQCWNSLMNTKRLLRRSRQGSKMNPMAKAKQSRKIEEV